MLAAAGPQRRSFSADGSLDPRICDQEPHSLCAHMPSLAFNFFFPRSVEISSSNNSHVKLLGKANLTLSYLSSYFNSVQEKKPNFLQRLSISRKSTRNQKQQKTAFSCFGNEAWSLPYSSFPKKPTDYPLICRVHNPLSLCIQIQLSFLCCFFLVKWQLFQRTVSGLLAHLIPGTFPSLHG